MLHHRQFFDKALAGGVRLQRKIIVRKTFRKSSRITDTN